jgi:hypothetical protein
MECRPTYLTEYTDFGELELLLSNITIPNMKHRFKTLKENRSLTFGLVKHRIKKTIDLSVASKKYDLIYQKIMEIGNKIVPFEFTTIHLNKNVVAPRHKDSLVNRSSSVIVSFGDYKGCNLIVECPDPIEFNAKHHPIIFDGRSSFHWNTPLEYGTKYSLIFYNIS